MLYFTFNDYPGGIYYSQVIDVINYLNQLRENKLPIKLVAFISIRNFWQNRKKIKEKYSHSIVIPMFPGVQNWHWNKFFVFFVALFYPHSAVLCRGIFAFHLAYPFKKLGLFKKIIFDARGAYKAEFEEYKVINHPKIINSISHLEKEAIYYSDFKISVSNALVDYWKKEYLYNQKDFVVIPCTLSNAFLRSFPSEIEIQEKRKLLGFNEKDIIIVFSGSVAGWQSLHFIDKYLNKILENNALTKLLFLGNINIQDFSITKKYPNRMYQTNVSPDEVFDYLCIADYGWLVREQSITNRVASPVKFAEYLISGLKILISENIGDYTAFCYENQCGIIIKDELSIPTLNKLSYSEKLVIHQIALKNFTKENFKKEYQEIIRNAEL